MEQLSYYPAPSCQEAIIDIMNILKNDFNSDELKKVKDFALNYYNNNTPQWSLAAYYSGGMKMYSEEIKINYKRRKKIKRRLNGIIKMLVCINKLFRDVLEERYKPGGIFEQETTKKWNFMKKKYIQGKKKYIQGLGIRPITELKYQIQENQI